MANNTVKLAVEEATKKTTAGDGRIVRIIGPVVDVKFDGAVPPIYNALTVEAETPIGHLSTILEVESQLPGGMDDVRVARGQADTSALADAYRAALGTSKATTEKAQVALDAIDAFEASGKTMEDAARLMMSCSLPRASQGFPKAGPYTHLTLPTHNPV